MFGFFKKKEEVPDWRKKVDPPVYLTDFLKQQLFNFIAAYTQLTITKKLLATDTENVKAFINSLDNKINDLKDTSKEPKGWFTLPGEFFKSLNLSEKKRAIEILQPVQQLAITHLKMVTSDYDKLMTDTIRHKKLSKEYDDIRKEGGHISQNREFVAYWIQTISPQWFGIAHFVDDIKII